MKLYDRTLLATQLCVLNLNSHRAQPPNSFKMKDGLSTLCLIILFVVFSINNVKSYKILPGNLYRTTEFQPAYIARRFSSADDIAGPIPYDDDKIRGFPNDWLEGYRRYQYQPAYIARRFTNPGDPAQPIPYDDDRIRGFPNDWLEGYRRYQFRPAYIVRRFSSPGDIAQPIPYDDDRIRGFPNDWLEGYRRYHAPSHPYAPIEARNSYTPVWDNSIIMNVLKSHDSGISYAE